MHNDEAVNAILLQGLWERGEYRYNPDEYHGPTLPYATRLLLGLIGTQDFAAITESSLRGVTVAAGVALIPLLWLLRTALGQAGTAAAAILLATSPAMVFYSRYFIHEMLLVCFTMLFLAGGWRHLREPSAVWAALVGAGLGLMHATKETFVISVVAAGLAWLACRGWSHWRNGAAWRIPEHRLLRYWPVTLSVAAGVSLLLFTSLLTHPRGPVDSILTYLPWLHRAGGHSPHIHPWSFYFERLLGYSSHRGPLWTEAWIALLALVGSVGALRGAGLGTASTGFGRFLVFYTMAIASAYSLIPYKTPWCLLNFLMPAILLAGMGASILLQLTRRPAAVWIISLLLVAGTGHLAWQGWRCGQDSGQSRGNPYAYSPTLPNGVALADRVHGIARIAATGAQTEVLVVAPESAYWPLPWYLRSLKNVWWLESLPEKPVAPIVLAAAQLKAALDEKTQRRYLSVGYYELRPREFFELFVEFELWKRFVETLPRPKEDE